MANQRDAAIREASSSATKHKSEVARLIDELTGASKSTGS